MRRVWVNEKAIRHGSLIFCEEVISLWAPNLQWRRESRSLQKRRPLRCRRSRMQCVKLAFTDTHVLIRRAQARSSARWSESSGPAPPRLFVTRWHWDELLLDR